MVSQKTYLSIMLLVCPIAIQSAHDEKIVPTVHKSTKTSQAFVRDLFYPAPLEYTKKLSLLANFIDEKKTETTSTQEILKRAIIAFLVLQEQEAILLSNIEEAEKSCENPLFVNTLESDLKNLNKHYKEELELYYTTKKPIGYNARTYYKNRNQKDLERVEDFAELPRFNLNPLLAKNLARKIEKGIDATSTKRTSRSFSSDRIQWVAFKNEPNRATEKTLPAEDQVAAPSMFSSIPLIGRLF